MSRVDDVVVRDADVGDVSRIVELITLGSLGAERERPGELAGYVEALREIQRTEGSAVLVAECGPTRDAHVIGVCQLIFFRHLQHQGGRCAEIESLHVHPDWRSQGIGGLIMAEAERRAMEAGCYRLQLTSNAARKDAHRFYKNHGYVPSHLGFKRFFALDTEGEAQHPSS